MLFRVQFHTWFSVPLKNNEYHYIQFSFSHFHWPKYSSYGDKNIIKKYSWVVQYMQTVKVQQHSAVSGIIQCLWAHMHHQNLWQMMASVCWYYTMGSPTSISQAISLLRLLANASKCCAALGFDCKFSDVQSKINIKTMNNNTLFFINACQYFVYK